MRRLIAMSALCAYPPVAFAEAPDINNFLGTWSCQYSRVDAAPTDEVRTQEFSIAENGLATATGKYAVGHATGIQADYRSTVRFELGVSTFTLHLVNYDLIEPVRDGERLSQDEELEFEAQVMTAKPVKYEFSWLESDLFEAVSGFTKTKCQRRVEAVS